MTAWIDHVKKVHAAGSTSFKESLKRASASWKKVKASKASSTAEKAAPKKKRRRRKKAAVPDEEEAPKKKRVRKRPGRPLPQKGFKGIDSQNLS